MNRYLAYFDLLGYRQFLLRNAHDDLYRRVGHVLRDVEMSLGQGKYVELDPGRVGADLSQSPISTLIYSDTILFYTNNNSTDLLEEILKVAHEFNWRMNLYNMPVRGCVYYGELTGRFGQMNNDQDASYRLGTVYGKGIVLAHDMAEGLSFAGAVIDGTVIDRLRALEIEPDPFLSRYAKRYPVPSKYSGVNGQENYIFRISATELNSTSFTNYSEDIRSTFARDKKETDHPRVQEILKNSIDYLRSFLPTEEGKK